MMVVQNDAALLALKWRAVPDGQRVHIVTEEYEPVAIVAPYANTDGEPNPLDAQSARLIAAAPELYAACSAIEHAWDLEDIMLAKVARTLVDAAVAKVRSA